MADVMSIFYIQSMLSICNKILCNNKKYIYKCVEVQGVDESGSNFQVLTGEWGRWWFPQNICHPSRLNTYSCEGRWTGKHKITFFREKEILHVEVRLTKVRCGVIFLLSLGSKHHRKRLTCIVDSNSKVYGLTVPTSHPCAHLPESLKSNKDNRHVRDVFVLVRLCWDQFSPQRRSGANTNTRVVRLTSYRPMA